MNDEKPAPEVPAFAPYEILFEDNNLVVANKLSPLSAQKDKSGEPSLQELLRAEIEGRMGKPLTFFEAVHRIDRRSSGLVLFAKTAETAAILSKAFRYHKIKKTYWAVVDRAPEPSEGRLEHYLVWDARKDKSFVTEASAAGAQKASMTYRAAAQSDRYVLLEIQLETGRSHQIRAQLSALGLPIRGDVKYGAKRTLANGLIMLHARSLNFRHPLDRTPLSFSAEPPVSETLWSVFFNPPT